MRIKQITVPISQEHPQPTKVSLKSIEGDLDVMVRDLNTHIAGAATMTGAETLENKTLASPTIDTPTINTPTIVTPTVTGDLSSTGTAQFLSGTDVPVGGDVAIGIKATSTADLGVYFGSGAPTLTAAQGSIYIRTDGTGTDDRFYIRTDTDWTAGTTAE